MIWLIGLPIWVIFWGTCLSEKSRLKMSKKSYMIICAVALIFVLGLRSKYTGSTDTYYYVEAFLGAKNYPALLSYLNQIKVFDGSWIFSECGFFVYNWLAAKLLPGSQWFILLTSAIIVISTSKFIYRHSDDPVISWLVFICLGSMTFAMNGMRQALAMSICLLSYRFVEEKKPVRFLLVVLLAVLFHKSAMIFALVYPMRNMKLNIRSFAFLVVGVSLFLAYAQRLAFLYDSLTGEDYAVGESFESGGIVTILIYVVAIVGMLLAYKKLNNSEKILPFVLVVVGFSMYVGRFISAQIYERISYYFAYFLMLVFPVVVNNSNSKIRETVRLGFVLMCVLLFVYRISKGAFANFEMYW